MTLEHCVGCIIMDTRIGPAKHRSVMKLEDTYLQFAQMADILGVKP